MTYYINLHEYHYEISSKPGRTVVAWGDSLDELSKYMEYIACDESSLRHGLKLQPNDIKWEKNFEPIRTPDNLYIIDKNDIEHARSLGLNVQYDEMDDVGFIMSENILNIPSDINVTYKKEYNPPRTPWHSRLEYSQLTPNLLEDFEIEVLIYRVLDSPEIADRMYEIGQEFGRHDRDYDGQPVFTKILSLHENENINITEVKAEGLAGVFTYYTFYIPTHFYSYNTLKNGLSDELSIEESFLKKKSIQQKEMYREFEESMEKVSRILQADNDFQEYMKSLWTKRG